MASLIRIAGPQDAEAIAGIYAPFVIDTPVSFETVPPDTEAMRQRVERVLKQFPWLVCDDDSEIIGFAYASPHRDRAAYRWSVDTAVYIARGHHRRGIGRALYTALLGILPLQGVRNAFAGITLPNEGSVGLHEAMGFQPIGVYRSVGYKLKRWHDVGWWQRPLAPYTEPLDTLVPITDLLNDERLSDCIRLGERLLRPGG